MNRRPVLTLLVNPTSGRGRARRALPYVRTALAEHLSTTTVRVLASTSWHHARELAERVVAEAEPGDSLVVIGGDGMASIGLNACANTVVPLGIIPAGTGNDFCRGVGLPTTVKKAVAAIVAGHTRRIDLMSVTGTLDDGRTQRFVGSVVSTGYDQIVNARANQLPAAAGKLAYMWALFAELRSFRPLRYRLLIDGEPRELDGILVAVANAGVFGGGVRICPDADLTDGLLDLTIAHSVRIRDLLKLFPTLFTGGFTSHPAIERCRARTVVVDGDGLFGMADGEDLGPVPLTLQAAPGVLTVVG